MKEPLRSKFIPAVQITLAGLVLMGLAYGVYVLFHTIIFRTSMAAFERVIPTAYTRPVFAALMVLAYWLVSRSKMKDLYKAMSSTVPIATLIIAVGVGLFHQPAIAWVMKLLILAGAILLCVKAKKPWMYYYAAVLAALASMFY